MDIGTRMKINYESSTQISLVRRMPVIVRLDGKAFHGLTRDCSRPFDHTFSHCMEVTATELCRNVQNVRMAYSQSDEISLLLVDYNKLDSQQWFDGNIQKIVSISASIASTVFTKKFGSVGYFDSRVFNIPKEEVCNYFIWRQQDAVRNSIQMVAQAEFSHKSLQGLSCTKLQEKLFSERGINWDGIVTRFKRGFCIIPRWETDNEIPVFTSDRKYIEKFLEIES